MRQLSTRSNLAMFLLLIWLLLPSCLSSGPGEERIRITIDVDNETRELQIPQGATVFNALKQANIELGTYDRVDPPSYSLLAEDSRITVTRVSETLTIENKVIAFERQIIRNEALSEGEERLLQAGQNGLQEITYRVIDEENKEPYQVIVNRVILEEPIPEILMIGAKRSFVPATFTGSIAYASAGNVWLIDGTTGNRSLLILSGDVDGRIFNLSHDGRWLLFTRASENEEDSINSLWIIETQTVSPEPVELFVSNVVHFANWGPQSSEDEPTYTLAYSTVEPRPFAPGWQANNDLIILTIDEAGDILRKRQILETNPGGQYGWWGTDFSWSPESDKIAYARADSIGIIDLTEGDMEEAIAITPYQTFGDWTWIPHVDWSPDGQTIFFVDHARPMSLESPEASQAFDLVALPISYEYTIALVSQVGMFSSFAPSPMEQLPSGENTYTVALLQAIFPLESETSNYHLVLIDRDGSNRRTIFPPDGENGIEPNRIRWSPEGDKLAIIYRSDLWLIDQQIGLDLQLTADGQTIAFDWSP